VICFSVARNIKCRGNHTHGKVDGLCCARLNSIKAFPEHPPWITHLWGRAIKHLTISYLTKVIGISES
jgi:hypothetical protein